MNFGNAWVEKPIKKRTSGHWRVGCCWAIRKNSSLLRQWSITSLLTGPTSVNLIFYSKFTTAQRAIVSDFITSLSSIPTSTSSSARPSISTWWSNTLKVYTPSALLLFSGSLSLFSNSRRWVQLHRQAPPVEAHRPPRLGQGRQAQLRQPRPYRCRRRRQRLLLHPVRHPRVFPMGPAQGEQVRVYLSGQLRHPVPRPALGRMWPWQRPATAAASSRTHARSPPSPRTTGRVSF